MIGNAEVWLLRHGHAGGASDDLTRAQDAARVLSPKGVKQCQRAGEVLAKIGPEFAAVFTSPAIRCRQSADLVAPGLGLRPVLKPQLGEPPSSGNIESLVREGRAVLIVGHGRYFPPDIKKLTGKSIDVDKGGLLGITITNGQGKVDRLLSSSDIKALT